MKSEEARARKQLVHTRFDWSLPRPPYWSTLRAAHTCLGLITAQNRRLASYPPNFGELARPWREHWQNDMDWCRTQFPMPLP